MRRRAGAGDRGGTRAGRGARAAAVEEDGEEGKRRRQRGSGRRKRRRRVMAEGEDRVGDGSEKKEERWWPTYL